MPESKRRLVPNYPVMTAMRLTERDHRYIGALIRSGYARNKTDAVRYALQFTAQKVAA